jgi:hypothetical protein
VNANCVACGAETGEDAVRCPSCGLAFAPAAEGSFVPPPAPPHVAIYLGETPRTFAAAAEDLDAEAGRETPVVPRRPADPRTVRRRWIVAACVAAAVIAAVVALVRAYRPNDSWTRQESRFRRLENSPRLASVPIPGPREVALDSRASAFEPLPDPRGMSVHAYFDAFLDRVMAIQPDRAWSIRGGAAALAVRGEEPETDAAWDRLCEAAASALREWPDADRLSPHDRADVAALRGWVEWILRRRRQPDANRLLTMVRWFDPLVRLQVGTSEPDDVRLAAATRRLTELPPHLARAMELTEAPPRAVVLAAAARLDDASAYLADYAAAWPGADDAARARLRAAIATVRAAAARCAADLRGNVAARARGEPELGSENVAVVLRVLHGLDADAGELYERAVNALCDAHDDMRGLGRAARGAEPDAPAEDDVTWIRRLREHVADWVVSAPQDAGVRVQPMPGAWAHRAATAVYLDDGPSAEGIVLIRPPRKSRNDFEVALHEAMRLRALAHETYPGHRLEALFRHEVCALRRFVDDRLFVEGWGTYAEDLARETGALPDGKFARYAEAQCRADRARTTMIQLALATGAAPDVEVLELLRASGWPETTLADVGERATPECYELNYMLGADEIRRLRREEEERLGSAFDLRAFHTRLLREGPIPVPLIRRQWREERER